MVSVRAWKVSVVLFAAKPDIWATPSTYIYTWYFVNIYVHHHRYSDICTLISIIVESYHYTQNTLSVLIHLKSSIYKDIHDDDDTADNDGWQRLGCVELKSWQKLFSGFSTKCLLKANTTCCHILHCLTTILMPVCANFQVSGCHNLKMMIISGFQAF